jgi:wyosine [tRNA(Phe)-imidazoG37] synthetase (radical SAM superfamily)
MTTTRPRRLDFRDHRRELWDFRVVYPVISRRANGLSIGLNLNPDGACNFDCPYCQVDRTGPKVSRDVDLNRLQDELDALLCYVADGSLWDRPPFDTTALEMRVVRDLSFAGDGEPTAFSGFAEAIRRVIHVRDRHGLSHVPISLLTNATLLHRPAVRAGLALLDAANGRVWAKLDAGTEAWYRRIDGTRYPWSRVLSNLTETARHRPIVIQSMWHAFKDFTPGADERDAWGERLGEILAAGGQIDRVQVYSVARKPADPNVVPFSLSELEDVADRARALGLIVEVTP